MNIDPKIDTGGAAHPTPTTSTLNGDLIYGEPGMTLRDYFAGEALSKLANCDDTEEKAEYIAYRCYQLADAMLKARKRETL